MDFLKSGISIKNIAFSLCLPRPRIRTHRKSQTQQALSMLYDLTGSLLNERAVEREREKERQTDRQTDRDRDRQTDRQTVRQRRREREGGQGGGSELGVCGGGGGGGNKVQTSA